MRKYYLAIDIGASSGRHIVGWREDGEIKAKEVYRFPNGVQEQDGHLIWDIDALLSHVKAGIAAAKTEFSSIISLSIDTWGVDYVLLRGEVHVLPVYAYRDSRTEAVIPQVYSILPFSELYRRTGIQFQPFNTIYQLYADKLAGRLEGVTDFLMLPEYLLWRLCGMKAKEYTNATTQDWSAPNPENLTLRLFPDWVCRRCSQSCKSRERCLENMRESNASCVQRTTRLRRWRAFPWRKMRPTFPLVHGRFWASRHRNR